MEYVNLFPVSDFGGMVPTLDCCVGSPTKTGSVVRAFQIGDKVSLEYMNSFRDNLKYEDESHRFQECPELSEIVNTAPGTARPYKKKTYTPTGNLGKGAYT